MKPLRPTSTQVERLKKEPIGSGFFAYNYDGRYVMVIPFKIVDGVLLKPSGEPLSYECDDGTTLNYIVDSYRHE